ncbi:MAG TPA: ribosome small subunit-dependent GTPase A [Gemmatimonadaceae bacterium]|nr:ribosome small subunit-dependent GTPase A [Gemmatimonadaceae bacterium]
MGILEAWGWDARWAERLPETGGRGLEVGRVIGQDRARWTLQTRLVQGPARVTSTVRMDPYPVVGDWVLAAPGPMPSDPWSIVAVLPRRTRFSRGAAGTGTVEQVLAANIDTVWIVHGLDTPLHPRRIERYLALAWQSGATPEIVLTKADLAQDLAATISEVQQIALGVDVRVTSVTEAASVQALRDTVAPGRTVALLGPSGAGKSTLVNLLAGADLARTGQVRSRDRKGRHTTTRRELFQIGGGALLLDTPGLRELRVWDLDEGLEQAFPDIEELARHCRYRDCRHEAEPGCAVLAAVEASKLDSERLTSFRKLQREAAYQARQTDHRARAAAVSQHKTALKTLKHHPKYRPGS